MVRGRTAELTPGQTYVVVWRADGGNLADLQVNGANAGSGDLRGGDTDVRRYLFGMTEPSTSSRFDGWVAEILIYDRALDDCERDGLVSDSGRMVRRDARGGFAPCGGASAPDPPGSLQARRPPPTTSTLTGWTCRRRSRASSSSAGLDQAGAWAQIAGLPADATGFTDTGLESTTEYCYRVAAFNDAGPSRLFERGVRHDRCPGPSPAPVVVPTTGLRVRLVANDLTPVTCPRGQTAAVKQTPHRATPHAGRAGIHLPPSSGVNRQ